MSPKKSFIRLVALLCLSTFILNGCGSIFKQRWSNFRAYYNTFYNANLTYDDGLELQKDTYLKIEINPLLPIRIHISPNQNAGKDEFQNSIEKSADVLRRHKESKWADDAILLIGKSYFYQREFFSALEKFEELERSRNAQLQQKKNAIDVEAKNYQQSIYFTGLSYLELNLIPEGINYLRGKLEEENIKWDKKMKAHTYATLAELLVENEQFEEAQTELKNALGDLGNSEENANAYFLNGQLLERLNRNEDALASYKKVDGYHPHYELIYHSLRKSAEIARSENKLDEAYRIYRKMSRDDKNFENLTDLNYELAKTNLFRLNFEEAEEDYKDLLYHSITAPSKEVKALAYYDLGEIYRYYHDNLYQAQAYYDSAAAMNPNPDLIPEDFNADVLASNLEQYIELKNQQVRLDSLLHLGSLTKAEFDSALAVIKEQKRAEFEQMKKEQRDKANTLVNVGATNNNQGNTQNASSAGFLNHKNPTLIANASRQFKALWGNRPLVDNWRRMEFVQTLATSNDPEKNGATGTGAAQNEQDAILNQFNIDLSEIPFSEEAKEVSRYEIATLSYQLGNLFYLQLNELDSAVVHFQQVVNYPDTLKLKPKAYYSLATLFQQDKQEDVAKEYAEQLIELYPNTVYASEANKSFNLNKENLAFDQEQGTSKSDSLKQVFDQLEGFINNMSVSLKAERYKIFARANDSTQYGGVAWYKALDNTIKWAKMDSLFDEKLNSWLNVKSQWKDSLAQFNAGKDSLRVLLTDSLMETDSLQYQRIQTLVDSSLTAPDFTPYFPYLSAAWDSARSISTHLLTHPYVYPSEQKVQLIHQEIDLPPALKEARKPSADTTKFYSCVDADWQLTPIPSIEVFLSDSLQIPAELKSVSLFLDITYHIKTDIDGNIVDLELISPPSGTGIEQVLDDQIRTKMRFEPISLDGIKIQAECDIIFPMILEGKESATDSLITPQIKTDSTTVEPAQKDSVSIAPIKTDSSAQSNQ